MSSSSSTFVGPSSLPSSSQSQSSNTASAPHDSLPNTSATATTSTLPSSSSSSQPVFLSTVTPDSAYLTPATHDRLLSEVLSLSSNPAALITFESRRSQACGLITAVGGRLGLPLRTIDTAFVVWQKCAVQMGASSGTTGQQVALAAILVACKLNDTLKKAREVIIASFAIRFPDLVKHASTSSSSSYSTLHDISLASMSESDVDPQVLEAERSKVLNLERTMLESVGYDFRIRQNVEHVARGVFKIGKAWGASKPFIRTAWQMSSDIHQTTAPLLYPPQVLSLAALLLAALLDCDDGQSSPAYKSSAQRILRVFDLPGGSDVALSNGSATTDVDGRDGVPRRAHGWARTGEWESQFKAYSDDIEDVVQSTLDLYLSSASSLASQRTTRGGPASSGGAGTLPTSSPLSTSPLTPTSPASPSEYGSSGQSSRGLHTKFSHLPPHVFNPPPLGVSVWLHARNKRGKGSTLDPRSSSTSGPFAEFSHHLTESKIVLRQAEDRRRERGGVANGTDTRTANRAPIDESKRDIQILRFSVQADVDDDGKDSSQPPLQQQQPPPPPPTSSRSQITNHSSTTILMEISEAARATQNVDVDDVGVATTATTDSSNTSSVSTPLPSSSNATPVTTSTPHTAKTNINGTGASSTAAAAVKAGKAVKTTRFLF